MRLLPIATLLSFTAAIGFYMGLRYLRGEANKPHMIGAHVLLGFAAMEPAAFALRGSEAANFATLILGFLVMAFASGAIAQLIRPRSERVQTAALALHAALGSAGCLLVLLIMQRMIHA